MNKYEELASEIIDMISDVIEEHYDITPKVLTKGDDIEHPALLNGEVYYNLEDEIAEMIQKV